MAECTVRPETGAEYFTRRELVSMTTELTTTTEAIEHIDAALATCQPELLREMSMMQRTLTLSRAMTALRLNFRGEVLERMKGLADTPLGFLTDRKDGGKPPYPDDVIRDCVIEAMLRGAEPVGNEFNIIAGRCYLTKQFFERALHKVPGFTELRLVEGVPTVAQNVGGALVPYRASWRMNGVEDDLVCDLTEHGDSRIAVRVNAQMGVDAILGKAKRKMLARIYARVTGSEWVEEEADGVEAVTPASVVETVELEPAATE